MRAYSGVLLFASIVACSSQRAAVAPNAEANSQPRLPFIEDDYSRALAEARARHVPIFVETWASW
jgi:hypothetical protein